MRRRAPFERLVGAPCNQPRRRRYPGWQRDAEATAQPCQVPVARLPSLRNIRTISAGGRAWLNR